MLLWPHVLLLVAATAVTTADLGEVLTVADPEAETQFGVGAESSDEQGDESCALQVSPMPGAGSKSQAKRERVAPAIAEDAVVNKKSVELASTVDAATVSSLPSASDAKQVNQHVHTDPAAEAAASRTVLADAVPSAGAPSVSSALLEADEAQPLKLLNEHVHRMWVHASSWYQAVVNLMAGISFALVIKAMCMIGNILVQVSPFPQVKRWESRGCTGEADAAPYISIMFGGWQWCYYGAFAYFFTGKTGFLILVQSNCLGAVLGTFYIMTYWRNCKNQVSQASLNKYFVVVLAIVMFEACALFSLPLERALFLTGLVSSFCSFLSSLSMLVVVPTVLRTQSAKSIPGTLVFANMLSAIVWVICGVILEDPLVTRPNIVSVLVSATCLYLKWMFPCSEEEGDTEKSSKAKMMPQLKEPTSKSMAVETSGSKASDQQPVEDQSSSAQSVTCDSGGTGETS